MPKFDENKLLKDLGARGFESMTIEQAQADGRVKVSANKLHPLSSDKDPVYAPVPVALSVNVDAKGHVAGITGDTPDPASVAAAVHQMNALRETGQLEDTTAPRASAAVAAAAAAAHPTHGITRDDKGRRVMRRRRFSAV